MAGVVTVLIGWCSMRESPNVYKIDKIRCYCLISGYCFVTTLVHVIYLKVNPEAFNIETDQKQMLAIISNSVALCLFAGGTYLSKQLYDELRMNHQFPDPEFMQEPSMFGGSRGPAQATQANAQPRPNVANIPRQQQQAYNARQAAAPPPQSNNTGSRGFQAFS